MKSVLYYVRLQRKYIKTNVCDRRIEPLYTRNQICYTVHFTFVFRIKRKSNNRHTILDTEVTILLWYYYCCVLFWFLILNPLLADNIECISKFPWRWWSEVQYYIIIVFALSTVVVAVHGAVFIISKCDPGFEKGLNHALLNPNTIRSHDNIIFPTAVSVIRNNKGKTPAVDNSA